MRYARILYPCLLAVVAGVNATDAEWTYKTTEDGQFKLGRDGSNLSVEVRSMMVTFRVPENWHITSCIDEPMDFIFAADSSSNNRSLAFTIDKNGRPMSLPRQYTSHLAHLRTVYDDKIQMRAEKPFRLHDGRLLTPQRYFSDYWGQRLVLFIPEGEYTCEFEFSGKKSLSDLRKSHNSIQRILDSYRSSRNSRPIDKSSSETLDKHISDMPNEWRS
jgi:hypothetical protein